ncbi:hypothetical protein RRG08_035467, partial [Elysia crispata]
CGQALTGNNGTLKSPNYPYNYPNNARCVWTITTDPDTRVMLTFSYFQLEYGYDCAYDFLVIRDGSDPTSNVLQRLCGSSTPETIVSTGNVMFIEFQTNYRRIYKGFQAQWYSREVCGSALSGNNGTFQSPNYPNNYPNNVYCEWTIRTDVGTKVQLTFSAFELHNSYYCSSSIDSVTIRDGSNSTAGLIGRLCGSGYSDSIVTSGNSLYILFTSDNSFSLSGFQGQWSINQGCGQALFGNNGTLESPNYPYNYPNNARCVWTITTDPDTRVVLTFSYFRLEYDYGCDDDSLVIRDGSDPTSNTLRRLCGSSTPQPIRATGNIMFIEFKTDYRTIYKGFQARWESQEVCGSALSGNNGTFQSPNYPNNYPNNVYCEWTIRTDLGTKVQLTFSAFELQNSYYCSSSVDSVTIHDGSNSTAGFLGRLCGSGYSDSIVASSNSLYILFTSDNSFSLSGFQAQWSINQGCGQALTGNNGTLKSPNYPYNYPNDARCVWTITTDPDTRVMLTFSYFRLEYGYECDYDFLVIRDGSDPTSNVLQRLCGSSTPETIISTGNVMFIEFQTNYRRIYKGFQAQWYSREVCGSALSGNNGTFQSPNYPNNYPNNAYCEWTIRTDPGTKVQLTFSAFELENSYYCSSRIDSVTIRDGSNSTAGLIGRLCGSGYSDSIVASGNSLYIFFTSDNSFSISGFQAQWSINHGCGEALTGNNGTIQSPNYPYNYPNNIHCEWTITADPGQRIILRVPYIGLQYHYRCDYDSIAIYDGMNQTSRLLSKICGSSSPGPIVSTENVMFIKFRSNFGYSYRGRGFHAQWLASEGCGEAMIGNEGTFQSPNYHNRSTDVSFCEWAITTEVGSKVVLSFSAFSLGSSYNCDAELYIYDGNNATSRTLRRLCGSAPVRNITASGNVMFIRFISNGTVTGVGFQARWSMIPGCVRNLTGNQGTLQSPNYPNNYPNGALCTWIITTDPGTQVTLTFSAFSLETDSSCDFDSLVIRDGNNRSSPILGTFCGSSRPPVVTASGNVMFISFTTDSSVTRTGFRAQWVGVNRNIHSRLEGCDQAFRVCLSLYSAESFQPNDYCTSMRKILQGFPPLQMHKCSWENCASESSTRYQRFQNFLMSFRSDNTISLDYIDLPRTGHRQSKRITHTLNVEM